MKTETTEQYHARIKSEAVRNVENKLAKIKGNRQALKEEKETLARDLLESEELTLEQFAWLFNGSYGHGEALRAYEIVDNAGNDRMAAIMAWQFFCAIDYGLSTPHVSKVMKEVYGDNLEAFNARLAAIMRGAVDENRESITGA